MGRFIPKTATAVDAFQWKPNYRTSVYELVNYLTLNKIDFELHWSTVGVAIIIGDEDCDDDDNMYIRLEPMMWVVFTVDGYMTMTTSEFFEKYRTADV